MMISYSVRTFFIWVGGHLLGFAVSLGLLFAIPALMQIRSPLLPAVLLMVPMAVAQWLTLRRLAAMSPLWLLTLPLGWILFYGGVPLLPAGIWDVIDDESLGFLILAFTVMGVIIGLLQWLLLTRIFQRAALWIPASAAGLGLGFGFVLLTDLIHRNEIVAYVVVVLIYALVTGLAFSALQKKATRSMTEKNMES